MKGSFFSLDKIKHIRLLVLFLLVGWLVGFVSLFVCFCGFSLLFLVTLNLKLYEFEYEIFVFFNTFQNIFL